MPVYASSVSEWLDSPTGRVFLAAEREAVSPQLGRMFGSQFLQVGHWGTPPAFMQFPGTARRTLCGASHGSGVSFLARPERLPVSAHSVDALLLPHTIELSRDPHEVLREAERVLTGGGRLMILGFNPVSLLGVRRFVARGAYPPGLNHLVTQHRLRDWLALLGFDVTVSRQYFPALRGGSTFRDRLRRLPFFYGAYMVVAVKRVFVVTPLKRRWRTPAKVTAGLVEPSTRSRS